MKLADLQLLILITNKKREKPINPAPLFFYCVSSRYLIIN